MIVVSIIADIAAPTRVSIAKADPDAGGLRVQFDMPAQPLAAALESFMAAAKVAVFVDSATISGRRSAALQGSFSPEGALRSLLVGRLRSRRRGGATTTISIRKKSFTPGKNGERCSQRSRNYPRGGVLSFLLRASTSFRIGRSQGDLGYQSTPSIAN